MTNAHMLKKQLIVRNIILFVVFLFFTQKVTYATHAAGADITYTCLGGNNYEITLTFYRDCGGYDAPDDPKIDISSATCGYVGFFDLSLTLAQQGPPEEISPICSSQSTTCEGGAWPGIQKYVYSAQITLPEECTDWIIDWEYCCRNESITTIVDPGDAELHVQALINNVGDHCNSSTIFSNSPIPFVCVQANYCFDHGIINPDADSLSFSLVTPLSGGNQLVEYEAGFSVNEPVTSDNNFPFTFNPNNGSFCFNSLNQLITIIAVQVREYKDGELVGYTMRDMQIYTIACNNDNPITSGYNLSSLNTNSTDTTVCPGIPLVLQIEGSDPNNGDEVTMEVINQIPDANYNINNADPSNPVLTITWTPSSDDISNAPYCFTVNLVDDNCPYQGTFSQSYCISVAGLEVNAGADVLGAPCNINHNTSAIVTGGTSPFNYLWSTTDNTSNVTLACGTHSITVTDALGCTGTDEILIDCPQIVLDTSWQDETCNDFNDGQAAVIASNGTPNYNYLWDTDPAQFTATATDLPDGVYTVTVTDAGGCVEYASFIIEPGPIIPDLFIEIEDLFCLSDSPVPLEASYPGGSWFGPGISGNNYDPSLAGVGNHTIGYGIPGECGDTAFLTINVRTINIDSIVTTATSCPGTNDGTAQVFSTETIDSSLFVYSIGDTTLEYVLTIDSLSANTYSLYGIWQDSLFCIVDSVTIIEEPEDLSISAIIQNTQCHNTCDGQVNLNVSGGTSPYSFLWNTGQTDSFLSNVCENSYMVTISDQNNCSKDTTIEISSPTPFDFAIGSDSAFCETNTGSAFIYNITGGTSPYSFYWDNVQIGQTNDTVFFLLPQTYTLILTDANNCDSVISVEVHNISEPTLSFTTDSTTCYYSSDGSATVTATGGPFPGNYTYQWQNGETTQTITNLASNIYEVTVLSNGLCEVTATVYVPKPSPGTINTNFIDTLICQETPVELMAQANGGTPPYSYLWNNGWQGPGPFIDTPNVFTCYTLTVTDANGCIITPTSSCVNLYPLINVTATQNQQICAGDSITLNALAYGGNSNVSYTYNWGDVPSPQSSVTVAPIGTYPDQVLYVVEVNDNCSPSAFDTVTIEFYEQSMPLFSPLDTIICPGGSVYFKNLSAQNFNSCLWDFGDGNFSASCQPLPANYTYQQPGMYTTSLTGTSQEGCKSTIFGNVEVVNFPYALFTNEPPVGDLRNLTFQFIDQSEYNVVSWEWVFWNKEFEDTLHTSTKNNPNIDYFTYLNNGEDQLLTFEDTGQYPVQLFISTEEGCLADTTLFIRINPVVYYYIPNTFTPNIDGKNETFHPVIFGLDERSYDFSIYDRWGELLYRTVFYDEAWDGAYAEKDKSEVVAQGVYTWQLYFKDIHGDEHRHSGHVNLVK